MDSVLWPVTDVWKYSDFTTKLAFFIIFATIVLTAVSGLWWQPWMFIAFFVVMVWAVKVRIRGIETQEKTHEHAEA